jgi:hypothetical protein
VVMSRGGGQYFVYGTPAYRRAGSYRVEVGISDRFLRGIVVHSTAFVSNARVVAIGQVVRVRAGRAFTAVTAVLVRRNQLAEPGDYRATVTWGDGTRSTARVRPARYGRLAIVASHRFARPGTYRVVTRVFEAGRLKATARGSAIVTR